MLEKMRMVIHSLLAMYVHFLSAALAMNMKGRMGISHALNVKPDTRDTKVVLRISFSLDIDLVFLTSAHTHSILHLCDSLLFARVAYNTKY